MSHLDDGLIQELIDGEIPSRDLAPIQAHLASCTACAARVEEARELAGEADAMIGWLDEDDASPGAAAPPPDIAPRPRVSTWPRNLAWAASLVLAVGLGYTARGGLVPPPSTPAGAPAATAATDESALPVEPQSVTEDRSSEQAPTRTSGRMPAAAEPEAMPPTTEARPASETARRDADASPAAPAPDPGRAMPSASTASGMANRLELGAPPPTSAEREAPRQRLAAADESAVGAGREGAGAAREAAKASIVPVRTADSTGTPAGPLFLISGMDPLRFAVSDTEVRVVYRHVDGEVQLVQRRLGARVVWHLEAPAGFPADSLTALAARVH